MCSSSLGRVVSEAGLASDDHAGPPGWPGREKKR